MLKKIISGLLALTTAASIAALSANAEHAFGDVDDSGKLDIEDVVTVINYINGLKSLSDTQVNYADTNCDGTVDILDAVSMIEYVNGTGHSEGKVYENSVFSLTYSPYWDTFEEGKDYISLNHFEEGHSVTKYYGTVSVDYERFTVTEFDDVKNYAKKCIDISYLSMESSEYEGDYYITGEKKINFNGCDAYEIELVCKYYDDITNYLDYIFISRGDYIICVNSNYLKDYKDSIAPEIKTLYSGLKFK